MENNFEFKSFEPKRNYLFLVEFKNDCGIKIEERLIKSVSPIEWKDDKWSDIKIIFYDAINPSTSQELIKFLELSKTKKDSPLFEIIIKALDPTLVPIEEWSIPVEKIVNIEFATFDYSDLEIRCPNMVVKPLNCIIKY